jgi:hypothetical protein
MFDDVVDDDGGAVKQGSSSKVSKLRHRILLFEYKYKSLKVADDDDGDYDDNMNEDEIEDGDEDDCKHSLKR